MTLSINDTQHNVNLPSNTQYSEGLIVARSINSVIMVNVDMLSIDLLNGFMLNVIMLSVVVTKKFERQLLGIL